MLSKREWLLTEYDSNNKYLLTESTETPMEYTLQPIQEDWQRQFDGKACQGIFSIIKHVYSLNSIYFIHNVCICSPNKDKAGAIRMFL